MPAQDDGLFGQFAVGQLVPTDDLPAFAAHVVGHTPHEVPLQGFFVRQMFLADARLAEGALLPIGFARLVTSQVDVMRREKFHNLIQYALQEGVNLVIAGTENGFGVIASQAGQHSDKLLHHGAGVFGISG